MQIPTERRHEDREAPTLRGPAIADLGQARVAVSVLNVSHAGLMMELTEEATLPTSFTLLFADAKQPCELVWRKGTIAGVRFAVDPK